jgi:thioester reductase-like protein
VVPATGLAPPRALPPRRILLTGATGFLGGYLADELLERGASHVSCIVRAESDAEAADRLRTALTTGGRPRAATMVGTMLHAIAGRLEEPELGLGNARFTALAQGIEAILHCAAKVDFLAPYDALRGANIDGIRNVLRLAALGGGTQLHYISSLAVFDSEEFFGVPRVLETEMPERADGFLHAYGQTKWVAERNLRTAGNRGIPIAIHRPGNITGDSKTGYWPSGDALTRMLRLCALIGAAPDLDLGIEFTPVDFVAAAVTAVLMADEGGGATLHLTAPERTTLRTLTIWLNAYGVPCVTVPVTEWLARVDRFAVSSPDDPASGLAPLLLRGTGQARRSFLDLAAARPEFDTTITSRKLESLGISRGQIGETGFFRYLAGLSATGFLPEPAGGSLRLNTC